MAEQRTTTTFHFDGREIFIEHRDMGSDHSEKGEGDQEEEEEEECYVDPHFFEEGYTVAAMTGFTRVWEAAEVLTRIMDGGSVVAGGAGESSKENYLRDRIKGGARLVELGSGVGLVGICAAALGGHVLLTDLHSIVDNVLKGNVSRNADDKDEIAGIGDSSGEESDVDNGEVDEETKEEDWQRYEDLPRQGPWPRSRPISKGTASARSLDWTKPVEDQVRSNPSAGDPRHADLVLIADCTWLRELLGPCVRTAVSLMRGGSYRQRPTTCIVAHRERDSGEYFLAARELVEAFEKAGPCKTEVLYTIPSKDEDGRNILVYEFTLC